MLLRDDLSQAIHDQWCLHAENAVLAFYTEVSCGASMTWVDEWKRRNKKKTLWKFAKDEKIVDETVASNQ